MQLTEFENEPTKKRHPSYDGSMLYTTAPEWSTGEVLLAAAYRRLVLGVGESSVDLRNITLAAGRMPAAVGGAQVWEPLLTQKGGIASPLRHGQYSPTASRQLMPLVPTIARIAGVLGKTPRSRWNPSNLLFETIGGGIGKAAGETLIRELGTSLQVSSNDDMFARFVEDALRQGLDGIQPMPEPSAPFGQIELQEDHMRGLRLSPAPRRLCPAERFCRDLPSLLALKGVLTRRQWTVLMEAAFRLGLGMHVLWTCNANIVMWELVLSTATGHGPPSAADVELAIWESHDEVRPLLEVGANGEPLIERLIESYAYARTGLNVLLCRLEDAGTGWSGTIPIGHSSQHDKDAPASLAEFLSHVHLHRQAIDTTDASQWLRTHVGELFDQQEDLRALATCKAGYTKNLFEFARHSLGQVKAKDPDQRCYDLSYLLAYTDDRKPLPVQPGPAMLIALVHACCAAHPSMPVSLDDFRRHLGDYGLRVPAGELVDGKTGRDLEVLGLVVDSPDAAGGRLLVKPL